MQIETLYSLAAVLAALSLASERIVAIVKSVLPDWFADPVARAASGAGAATSPKGKESWRQFRVQCVAVLAGWVTAAFLAVGPGGETSFNFFGAMNFATAGSTPMYVPVFIVGLLASGGSAFWASVVGYAQAVKDLKRKSV